MKNYASMGNPRHLDHALWELYNRSIDPKQTPKALIQGMENRRTGQSILLNTFDRNLDKLLVPPYADPFGFANEVSRLRDEQARSFVDAVIEKHREGFLEQMRALGRQGPFAAPDLDALRRRFTADFERSLSSLGERLLNMIEDALQQAEQAGTPPQQIRNDLRGEVQQELFDKGESLRIYFAQTLDRESQQAEGFESYIWRSMDDDEVRDSHAVNDDSVFSWDDPPETGHPGQDYGCRCWAEPMEEEGPGLDNSPINLDGIPRIEIYKSSSIEETHLAMSDSEDADEDEGDAHYASASHEFEAKQRQHKLARQKLSRRKMRAPGLSKPLKPLKPLRRPIFWTAMTIKAKRLTLRISKQKT